MFLGVNHVGVGVSNMERSLKFYGDHLDFTEVLFDYTGTLPGMEKVTGKNETKARVVMLKNRNTSPLGLGMVKLVQLLSGKPDPAGIGRDRLWGDMGVFELCFNARVSAEKVFAKLWDKGLTAELTPADILNPPYGTDLQYAYMRDPDDGLIEFINWRMCRSLGTEPNSSVEIEPAVEGVNHVGFGISNFETTSKFYRTLGFTELLFDIPPEQGLYGMATMMPSNPPRLRCTMLGNYYGAWIEPVQLMTRPQPRPPKKNWGHLGAMEFAIGVTNIDEAYDELQEKGIKFQSPPQTIAVNKREWKYAYLIEPDNLPVSIVEQRY